MYESYFPLTHTLTDSLQIKQGAKVDLPYWLTVPLSAQNIVKIGFPKFFQPQFRSALLADPMGTHTHMHTHI
jgi:hypothetical protein